MEDQISIEDKKILKEMLNRSIRKGSIIRYMLDNIAPLERSRILSHLNKIYGSDTVGHRDGFWD